MAYIYIFFFINSQFRIDGSSIECFLGMYIKMGDGTSKKGKIILLIYREQFGEHDILYTLIEQQIRLGTSSLAITIIGRFHCQY